MRIEIGSPRGMGAVTGVHVKHGAEWIALYKSPVLLEEAEVYKLTRQYWSWAPAICRTHFKTKSIRLEIDTSKDTGIQDWNCASIPNLGRPSAPRT